ncbi:hypothetical protein MPSEU_000500000 [Mayamaea pseudoterrestris]|nr:hypothetical protein MPSEU_000500000 [Mayamaea pseudoterrestris]
MSQQPCLPLQLGKTTKVFSASTAKCFDSVDIQALDASAYLAMVVHESRHLPDIFLSDPEPDFASKSKTVSKSRNMAPIDGSAASLMYLVSDRTTVRAPPTADHLPKHTDKWVDQTTLNFSALRDHLETWHEQGIGGKDTDRLPLPTMNDRPGWHIFCVGIDDARGNEGSYFDDDHATGKTMLGLADDAENIAALEGDDTPYWKRHLPSQGYTPTTSLLLQMDQVLVRRVLSHLIHYVREGWTITNSQRSTWIYALLARLELPIHREDAALLFGLLKSLAQTRGIMDAVKDREKLARVNVLITVVGIYFEQGGGVGALMRH